jgi:hypothetical protein
MGITAALAGLASFLVYLQTLAPSIIWGDSPELTAAAYMAGVPHPTGYPLYMLLAHTFLRFYPFGSAAFRMNLLAALSAGLAVALIYPLVWQVTRARWASLAATLLFAFSRTFWSQALIAEHYCLEILLIVALLGCVLAWDRRGERRWLFASAVLYGLCFTHHMMSLLLAPGLLFFALTSPHRSQFLRELPRTLPLFLLPLCLYLYLPVAALRDPPMNWGDPRTWDRFLAHVTGRQYQYAMFHMTRAQIWKQIGDYVWPGPHGGAGFLPAQFSPAFLWLAPLGAWSLARRCPRLFGLILLVYLADLVYAFNYPIYNVEIYYLPSHLMVALWIGCGLRQGSVWLEQLWHRLRPALARRPLPAVLGSALLFLPLLPLRANWRLNDHHDDWDTLAYAHAALTDLKPNAIVVGEADDFYFPLLYARYVEGRRPDITLLSAYDILSPQRLRLTTRLAGRGLTVTVPPHFRPRSGVRFDNRLLQRLVAENIGTRPLYLVASPAALQTSWLSQVMAPYFCIADSNLANLELSRRAPRLAVSRPRPQFPRGVTFGARRPDGSVPKDLEFLGYDLQPAQGAEGPQWQISYYWRVNNQTVARPAMVWVMFTEADGSYPRTRDGSPEFHNIHPLACGVGQRRPPLPVTLRESFQLYVPPRERNRSLHVRLAVAIGRRFLAVPGDTSPWVEIGQLPSLPRVGARRVRTTYARSPSSARRTAVYRSSGASSWRCRRVGARLPAAIMMTKAAVLHRNAE